jgi:hypothetical protein
MTEQWWEDFKTDFKERVSEARALFQIVQEYGVPANCDPLKMAKDVKAYRKAWEKMAETLDAIVAGQSRKEKQS